TSSRSRQTADQKITEGRTRMGATTFPLTDDIVPLGNQIRRTPEIEIRKCFTEIGHKRLDVVTAPARFMQRVLQQHVWCSDLIDNAQIDVLAPELRKPAADYGLVLLFFAHWNHSLWLDL